MDQRLVLLESFVDVIICNFATLDLDLKSLLQEVDLRDEDLPCGLLLLVDSVIIIDRLLSKLLQPIDVVFPLCFDIADHVVEVVLQLCDILKLLHIAFDLLAEYLLELRLLDIHLFEKHLLIGRKLLVDGCGELFELAVEVGFALIELGQLLLHQVDVVQVLERQVLLDLLSSLVHHQHELLFFLFAVINLCFEILLERLDLLHHSLVAAVLIVALLLRCLLDLLLNVLIVILQVLELILHLLLVDGDVAVREAEHLAADLHRLLAHVVAQAIGSVHGLELLAVEHGAVADLAFEVAHLVHGFFAVHHVLILHILLHPIIKYLNILLVLPATISTRLWNRTTSMRLLICLVHILNFEILFD